MEKTDGIIVYFTLKIPIHKNLQLFRANESRIKRVVIETTGFCDVTSFDVTSFVIHTDQICDS